MAHESQIDEAAKYDAKQRAKPINIHVPEEIYIQYEKDREQREKQREDTLDVLKFYRKTELIPTKRRIIETDKDLQFLIDILGLDDIG